MKKLWLILIVLSAQPLLLPAQQDSTRQHRFFKHLYLENNASLLYEYNNSIHISGVFPVSKITYLTPAFKSSLLIDPMAIERFAAPSFGVSRIYALNFSYNLWRFIDKSAQNFGIYAGISAYVDKRTSYVYNDSINIFYSSTGNNFSLYSDMLLKYKNIGIYYAHNITTEKLFKTQGMFGISIFAPLYLNISSVQQVSQAVSIHKNQWFLSTGLNLYWFYQSLQEVYKNTPHGGGYNVNYSTFFSGIPLPELSLGITHKSRYWMQQFSLKGLLWLRGELSIFYNFKPWFNPYKNTFAGVEVGVLTSTLNDTFLNGKTIDVYYGLFFTTQKKWYYGISASYNLFNGQRVQASERKVEVTDVFHFKFGKYFRLSKKNKE